MTAKKILMLVSDLMEDYAAMEILGTKIEP